MTQVFSQPFATVTDAPGVPGGGSSSSEGRTHNGQNQVTAVGGSGMSFDSNGSLTSDGTTGKTYTYDAWNALVKVTSGGATIASHEYDALRRQAQSGTTTPTDERWFSLNWQVLETRPADGKTVQFVWSPVYVDAMVARDRDTDANGTLEERVYPLHDANFDVTALVDTSGTVIERFTYDCYGTFTVLDANWATDADGLSDVAWGNFFQGLPYDATVQGSVARWRVVLHYLGRPLQADPIGYPDGMSRYEWEKSSPNSRVDPYGLQAGPTPEEKRRYEQNARRHSQQPRGGTYILKDAKGRVVRTGRTNDLARREREHRRRFPKLRLEVDRRTDSRDAQRGRAQMLQDKYKARLDKIRDVARNNRNLRRYLAAARRLGALLGWLAWPLAAIEAAAMMNALAKMLIAGLSDRFRLVPGEGEDISLIEMIRIALEKNTRKAPTPPNTYRSPEAALKEATPPLCPKGPIGPPVGRYDGYMYFDDARGYRFQVPYLVRGGTFRFGEGSYRQPEVLGD